MLIGTVERRLGNIKGVNWLLVCELRNVQQAMKVAQAIAHVRNAVFSIPELDLVAYQITAMIMEVSERVAIDLINDFRDTRTIHNAFKLSFGELSAVVADIDLSFTLTKMTDQVVVSSINVKTRK